MKETNTINGMPYLRIGNGEPLVLIHGLGGAKENWYKQFELSDQFQLIIPDLRGHGKNLSLEGISIINFANDIISLLEELKIEKAHFCGISMGGTVVQEIYRQAPDKCHSLLLVSSFHNAPKQLGKIFLKYRKVRSCLLSPSQQKLLTSRTCLYSWNKQNLNEFYTNFNPNKKGHEKSLKALSLVDFRSLLPIIKIPTLVIGGQYDAVLPVYIQIQMHKQIPNSQIVIYRKCGHIAKIEVADQFNRTVRSFLMKNMMIKNAV
ncbi:alpha/beta hydrolase [Bacillus sp. 1P10SD]|uniref:alpha/beta fold hydrolase n=1 Tax=Bacillus sp. 1P10SD TaxID=3132265 RepID=UPI0039A67325